jgi:SAM-dependent methyltransferase
MECGVPNLEFSQADLLRLPDTGLTFDSISCVGVLHHLQNPLDGLRALRRLMGRPRGLKLAIYTESGRQGIVAAIKLRESFALPPTAGGIRELRQIVYALPTAHPARQLIGTADFYSLSGCRDMAFHVMEHRYTLPAFAELAAAAGLRIEAIVAPDEWKRRFLLRYPDSDPATDIAAWHRFETEHPGLFGWMYRFMLAWA